MKCQICPHGCELNEGSCGICRARTLKDGSNISLNYGQVTSLALDPIEKKPLRDFMPGSLILSIGSWGCNMKCPWCQNDSISRGPARYREMTPEELSETAAALKPRGNIGLAYTYNEALVSPEFISDCAELIHNEGMVNVLVTNGMSEPNVFKDLCGLIDAANIDLKTMSSEKYRRIGGDLTAVCRNISAAAENIHLEVTTLIVPGFNDSEEEIREVASFLAGLDRNISLHVTRFHPAGEMKNLPATDVRLIYDLADIASDYLDHVYTGNC